MASRSFPSGFSAGARIEPVIGPQSMSTSLSSGATMGGTGLHANQFRLFFQVLQRAAKRARRAPEIEAQAIAQGLSKELARVIELQTLESRRLGGAFILDVEAKASFLKAALADEVMLNLDWAGRAHWHHFLVEATLFGSSLAGEKVFQDIESLLSAREPSQRDVARLYLDALALGFKGRYRGPEHGALLADLRRELFEFIFQRTPDFRGREAVLDLQPYEYTLSNYAPRRLPRISRWTVMYLLIVLCLLALSELLWLWASWPMRQMLQSTLAPSVAAFLS